jgi:hypothetical protein
VSIATTEKTEFGQRVRLWRWECLVCETAGMWHRDEVVARQGMAKHREGDRHAYNAQRPRAFRQGRRPGENEKKYISARCLSGRDELCNVVSCACACHGREQ